MSNADPSDPLPSLAVMAASLAAFAGLWKLVTYSLRRAAGLTHDATPMDAGPAMAESGWGSATINGIRVDNVCRVVAHQHGYVVRLMPLFGGGQLWLPRSRIAPTELDPGWGFGTSSLQIDCDGQDVRLRGRLAKFVASRLDRG